MVEFKKEILKLIIVINDRAILDNIGCSKDNYNYLKKTHNNLHGSDQWGIGVEGGEGGEGVGRPTLAVCGTNREFRNGRWCFPLKRKIVEY